MTGIDVEISKFLGAAYEVVEAGWEVSHSYKNKGEVFSSYGEAYEVAYGKAENFGEWTVRVMGLGKPATYKTWDRLMPVAKQITEMPMQGFREVFAKDNLHGALLKFDIDLVYAEIFNFLKIYSERYNG